jgi:hypothetical protein
VLVRVPYSAASLGLPRPSLSPGLAHDYGSWAGTFTGPAGQELRADRSGIHLRGPRDAPERLICWDEIGWLP